MSKKRPSSSEPPLLDPRVGELVARLDRLDAVLNQIELRLQPLSELPAGLAAARELALEAVAQAQDALDTSKLAQAHEERIRTLTLAVAQGIEHVDRAERRIAATVGRARRQLRDAGLSSPGLDAEAGDLHIVDDSPGPAGGVPPVPEDVDPRLDMDERLPSPIPGLSRAAFRRFRGA